MIFGIKPKFEFFVYNYKETEPIEIYPEYISSFSFKDEIGSGNFSINIPGGATKKLIRKTDGEVVGYLRNILSKGNFIHIKEDGKGLFAGYIKSVSDNVMSDGSGFYTVSGGGLEDFFKMQPIFIDASEIGKNISKNFRILNNAIKGLKTPGEIILGIGYGLFTLALSKWGDRSLDDLLFIEFGQNFGGVSKFTYFPNVIGIVNQFNGNPEGNRIDYWNICEGYAKQPIHELFIHYTDDKIFLSEEEPDFNPTIKAKNALGSVVFRQCPFWFVNSNYITTEVGQSQDSTILKVNQSRFDRFNPTDNLTDLFTGVSVTPPIVDQKQAGYVVPTRYYDESLMTFGQRVLNVGIDGYSTKKKADVNSYREGLLKIRDRIYDTFIGDGGLSPKEPRTISGTLAGDYFRGICKGKFIDIVDDSDGDKNLHKHLSRYDKRFYVSSVSVEANPESGQASMELGIKWGAWNNGI